MNAAKKASPEQATQARKRFEWLVSFLIVRFRFVHQVLGMMTKDPDSKIETMGVRVSEAGKFILRYSPAFVESLSDAEAVYVFYHEICHLVLHHCTTRRMSDHRLWNVATDLAVNELIPITAGSCEPPRQGGKLMGCFVSEMKKLPDFSDIQEKQTAEWYFDYLRKKQKEQGKGDGNDTIEGAGEGFDDHGDWREHEVADEKVRQKIKEIALNEMWGSMSQSNIEIILAAQTRKINWRNKIRTGFGNHSWKDRVNTRKRPNRRTGYIHPGTRKSYVDRWLVAADTSGSIDSDMLKDWLGVLNGLAEDFPIDFMQFDCEKTEEPHPYDRKRTKLEFKGRGGTSFQPVIDIVNKGRYRGVMLLTDGCAEAPTKPRMAKVIWVMPEGHKAPVEWGDKVYLTRLAK